MWNREFEAKIMAAIGTGELDHIFGSNTDFYCSRFLTELNNNVLGLTMEYFKSAKFIINYYLAQLSFMLYYHNVENYNVYGIISDVFYEFLKEYYDEKD